MNSRITVSFSDYICQNLVRVVPAGQISKFVTEAVGQKMASSSKSYSDPVAQFLAVGKSLPQKNIAGIIEAIGKGRK